jgi:hypothetical protein
MSVSRIGRIVLSLVPLFVAAGAHAEEFRIENATVPAPFLLPVASPGESPKVDTVIEASAIEAIGDGRYVLVAHDRTAGLFVVETATGQIVGSPVTCSRFPKDTPIPAKWEGLAADGRGFFYVIGTHSGKSDQDRPSRSYLFRFRLTTGNNGNPFAIDEGSVVRWRIENSLAEVLERETHDPAKVALRKIEGLTVRTVLDADGQPARVDLIVGLREPGDLVRTFAADITKAPEDGATLTLEPFFSFDAGSREGVASQLTSLHYSPEWKGFLVLTATEDKQNIFHGNTLWYVPEQDATPGARVKPEVLRVFEPAMKAEGLCSLPRSGRSSARALRLAVSFDNDPHATHIPSRLQVFTVSRVTVAN